MMAASLGTRFTHVPYRSGGLMLTAIHQGEGQFGIAVLASAAQQVRDGMVRGMALTSRERFPSFPDMPTLHEGALPGFDMTTWNMIIAPPRMPPAILAQLNRALARRCPRRRCASGCSAPASRLERTEHAGRRADFLQAEVRKYQEVVARTGIRLER
jgi:tripartite-type tricarboxylate transporter receptor subunit TctC